MPRSMTSRVPRLIALFGLSLGVLACKDENIDTGQYVDSWSSTVCDAVVACSCDYPNGALYDHCLAELGVSGSTLAELNHVEGLKFDGECAQKEIDAIGSLGCEVPLPDPDAECKTPCKVWYGPMGKGGTCTSINGYDNCKQGLSCGEGACVDPCDEPNLPKVGQACAPAYGCVEDAYCDTMTTPLYPTCAALPKAGVPCVDTDFGLLCAKDLVCDTSDPGAPVCAALPGVGEECPVGVCAEGLYCNNAQNPAVCAQAPTLGDACPLGLCEAPYQCEDAECVKPRPAVCGYYGGVPDGIESATGMDSGPTDSGPGTGGPDTGGLDTSGSDTGGADVGDCCTAHDTPGCTNVEIAACVCMTETACCTDLWDEACTAAVDGLGCGACG
jgi:hypothetical protein